MFARVLSHLRHQAAKRRFDAAFGHLKAKGKNAAARLDTRGFGKASKTLTNELHAALGRKPS